MMTNTQHLINAIERARNENLVVYEHGGTDQCFIVGNNGKAYIVSIVDDEITKCSCPQATNRNVLCKHMVKVSLEKNLNISQLNLVAGD